MSSRESDTWTKSDRVRQPSESRETMSLPDPPSEDNEDIKGTLVPQAWIDRGVYPVPRMLECIAYLSSALETVPDENGKITLRYIHVNKDRAIHIPVEVAETKPDTYAPVQLIDGSQFPVGVCFNVLSDSKEEPPTESERRAVWNLHEDHIRSETLFTPTSE